RTGPSQPRTTLVRPSDSSATTATRATAAATTYICRGSTDPSARIAARSGSRHCFRAMPEPLRRASIGLALVGALASSATISSRHAIAAGIVAAAVAATGARRLAVLLLCLLLAAGALGARVDAYRSADNQPAAR